MRQTFVYAVFFLCAGLSALSSAEAFSDPLANVMPRLRKAACSLSGFVELPLHDRNFGPGERKGVRKAIPFASAFSETPTESLKSWKELVTVETGYETEGAILCQQRRSLLGLLLTNGKIAWVNQRDASTITHYPDLLKEGPSFARKTWDGQLWPQVGQGTSRQIKLAPEQRDNLEFQVKSLERVQSKWWIQVVIPERDSCSETKQPVSGSFWIPAFSTGGEPVLWMRTRGC